jgi:hypothetical protein
MVNGDEKGKRNPQQEDKKNSLKILGCILFNIFNNQNRNEKSDNLHKG